MKTRMLITSASGGGKTWALRRLLEITSPMVQQIIIDPEGEFATLAEYFPILVLSGDDGPIPLNRCNPKMLALQLMKNKTSTVLDLSECDREDMDLFVSEFLRGLLQVPQDLWHHVIVAIDEAHLFAPQHDKSEAKKAVIDLAGRGRKRGLCPILATQRPAKLHKSVMSELQNRLIGGITLDVDVRRAADELGMPLQQTTRFLGELSPGEFFAYGPALTRRVTKIRIGPVVTRHGALSGKRNTRPVPPSERIVTRMAKHSLPPPKIDAPAGAVQRSLKNARENKLRDIAVSRVAILAPILGSPTGQRGRKISAAAKLAGVTTAAIYQWLSRYDETDPIGSLMPQRLSARTRALPTRTAITRSAA